MGLEGISNWQGIFFLLSLKHVFCKYRCESFRIFGLLSWETIDFVEINCLLLKDHNDTFGIAIRRLNPLEYLAVRSCNDADNGPNTTK